MTGKRPQRPHEYRVVPDSPPPPQQRPIPFEVPSELDREVVERKQLRHRATFMLGITRRCRHGYPQAFLCTPLRIVDQTIAAESSVFWLSCPLLVRAVDELEAKGWIQRLEEEVSRDERLRSQLERVHAEICSLRRALLPSCWRARLEQDPSLARQRWILFQTGLAGITRPEHVKCLHAHLADYLSRGTNPLGKLVWDELKRRGVAVEGSDCCYRWCQPEEVGSQPKKNCSDLRRVHEDR